MTYDEYTEMEKTTIDGIWKLLNRNDREIRVIGDDGKKRYALYNRFTTADGRDSISIEWNEDGEPFEVIFNASSPVEESNGMYTIWSDSEIAVRFVYVQPSF